MTKAYFSVSSVYLLMQKSNQSIGTKYRLAKRAYNKSGDHCGYLVYGPSAKWRFMALTRWSTWRKAKTDCNWTIYAEGNVIQIWAAASQTKMAPITKDWISDGLFPREGVAPTQVPRQSLNGLKFFLKFDYQIPNYYINEV